MVMETGRVCVKTAGREAGKYCVILEKVDKEFMMVTGPRVLTKVKRRKCNIRHLEPLPYKLNIKKDSSDSEVMKEYEKAKILDKLKIAMPSAGELKELEQKKQEKQAKKEKAAKETKKEPVAAPKAEVKKEVKKEIKKEEKK